VSTIESLLEGAVSAQYAIHSDGADARVRGLCHGDDTWAATCYKKEEKLQRLWRKLAHHQDAICSRDCGAQCGSIIDCAAVGVVYAQHINPHHGVKPIFE